MSHLNAMPKIGYGTWNRPDEAAFSGTLSALECGYRHIDAAEGYENEDHVGRAIAASGVLRADLWVTTKVAPESFGPGQVRPHVEASLEKLGVGPVDLLLLHYPSIKDEYDINEYAAQFVEVMDAGLARHLGVSNFTIPYLEKFSALIGDIPIFCNQVEIHPFMQNRTIVDYCAGKGIPMTAYSPLARGAVVDDATLMQIGAGHNATASQIALAFLLAEGHTVIPSSGSADRIKANLAAGDIALSEQEIAMIRALERNERLVDGPWCPPWDS